MRTRLVHSGLGRSGRWLGLSGQCPVPILGKGRGSVKILFSGAFTVVFALPVNGGIPEVAIRPLVKAGFAVEDFMRFHAGVPPCAKRANCVLAIFSVSRGFFWEKLGIFPKKK